VIGQLNFYLVRWILPIISHNLLLKSSTIRTNSCKQSWSGWHFGYFCIIRSMHYFFSLSLGLMKWLVLKTEQICQGVCVVCGGHRKLIALSKLKLLTWLSVEPKGDFCWRISGLFFIFNFVQFPIIICYSTEWKGHICYSLSDKSKRNGSFFFLCKRRIKKWVMVSRRSSL